LRGPARHFVPCVRTFAPHAAQRNVLTHGALERYPAKARLPTHSSRLKKKNARFPGRSRFNLPPRSTVLRFRGWQR
ncbi:hypothetical protein, partial [Thermomonas sp.]|uniref:hypothetical protein n=1 Tax=Thermomonas sp. TaxID=1971895 RepID=UPI003783146D